MPGGMCKFQDIWVSNPKYSLWLRKDRLDPRSARCILCAKSFAIGAMGESAIRSHQDSKKHKGENHSRHLFISFCWIDCLIKTDQKTDSLFGEGLLRFGGSSGQP